MELDKVRILVLGDSGVGKTSFVHLLCHEEPLQSPQWTVGCSVEMKLHAHRAGTANEREYFMEIWDVGGTPKYANTRSVFYTRSVGGVILVYDKTSQKSQSSLERWLTEVAVTRNGNQQRDEDDITLTAVAGASESSKPSAASGFTVRQPFGTSLTGSSVSSNPLASWTLPILLVGTKTDCVEQRRHEATAPRSSRLTMAGQSNCALETLPSLSGDSTHAARRPLQSVRTARFFDEIHLSNLEKRSLNPGSTNAVVLSRFFDAVIETSFGSNVNGSLSTSASFSNYLTTDNTDLSARIGGSHANTWSSNMYSPFAR